jgi:uncharacterized protein YjbI with pentapeptide repeats
MNNQSFSCWLCKAGLPLLLLLTNTATEKDYSGKDLANAVFKDGNLNKAKFDESNLRFADFTNATLKNASFLKANLENASFNRANLEGADFTGAKLRSASFTDAKAWHAKLAGTEIHLARATLITTDGLREKGFTFDQIDAINALAKTSQEKTSGSLSFHFADLRGCLILGNAEGVDFRDADLRGADLSNAENLDKARLKGAKTDGNTRWKPNPFIGKWLIVKEDGGANESGTLTILPDKNFQWSYTLVADPPQVLSGTWSDQDGGIVLKEGELGQSWTGKTILRRGKPELDLKSEKSQKRSAVKDEPE